MNWWNWYKRKNDPASENLSLLQEIANKIIKGNKEWTPEELQIQQNCSEALEKILNEHKRNIPPVIRDNTR